MKIMVDKNINTPIYMQIIDQVKQKIITGVFPHGFTLQSERALARELEIHRNTVAKAYAELKSMGYLISKQGIGYMVDYNEDLYETSYSRKVTWEQVLNEKYLYPESAFDKMYSKSYEKGIISFAGGISSPSVYKSEEIREYVTEAMNNSTAMDFFYSPYQGNIALRYELSNFIRRKGMVADSNHIQVVSEANQAKDILMSLLVKDGDFILTEEFLSPDVYRSIRHSGGNIITIPCDRDGMNCDHIEPIIEKYKPKLIYVSTAFQNPTGAILSLSRRKKLLELSYKYKLPIIEEDESSDLAYGKHDYPSIKSMDAGENVIYIHDFSLTFFTGAGISFVNAPRSVIAGMSYLVSVRLMSLEWLSQQLLMRTLETGIFYEKLELFKKEYREKRDVMCSYLDKAKIMGLKYNKPKGGVYIWCTLPSDKNIDELIWKSEKQGVTFLPGYVFSPTKNKYTNSFRLNFSFESLEEIKKGMNIIVENLLAL